MILTDIRFVRIAWFALNLARAVYKRFGYELVVSLSRAPVRRLSLVCWRFDTRNKRWSVVYSGRDRQLRERLVPFRWTMADSEKRRLRTELLL